MPKLTDQTALTTPENIDVIHVVDKSDTSSDAAGTSKQVALQHIPSAIATEIKTAYESNAETNAFTDAEKTKLDGLSGGGGGGTFSADITGSIGVGEAVSLNDDGTLTSVAPTSTVDSFTVSAMVDATTSTVDTVFTLAMSEDRVLVLWDDTTTGAQLMRCATVAANVPTYGSQVTLDDSQPTTNTFALRVSDTTALVFWVAETSTEGRYCLVTATGNTVTKGTTRVFSASPDKPTALCGAWLVDGTKLALSYRVSSSMYMQAATLAGDILTLDTPDLVQTISTTYCKMVALTSTSVAMCFTNYGTGWVGESQAFTLSGTDWTAGNIITLTSGQSHDPHIYRVSDTRYLLMSKDDGGAVSQQISGWVFDVSGATITNLGKQQVTGFGTIGFGMTQLSANVFVAMVRYLSGGTSYYRIIEFDGDETLTLSTFEQATEPSGVDTQRLVTFTSSTFFTAWEDTGIESESVVIVFENNSVGWIGYSQTTVADGPADILPVGHLETNQSGLVAGTKYYLNGDGSLTDQVNSIPIGRAITSTSILIEAK